MLSMERIERTALILQLVLLLTKHVDSIASSCLCEFPKSFCMEGITVIQGKIINLRLVDAEGISVSEESNALKTKYRIEFIQALINGSHAVSLNNNIFQFSFPKEDPCNSDLHDDMGLIVIGRVDYNGRIGKPMCLFPIPSRSNGLYTEARGLDIIGDPSTFEELCKKNFSIKL